MPRIPESRGTIPIRPDDVTTPIGLAVAPFAQGARAFAIQADATSRLEEARANAKRQIELNQALIGFQQGMNDLALAGEQETDPDALTRTFSEQSASLFASAREGIQDPIAKLDFEERALALHEERRIRTETRAVGLLQGQVRATNDARADQLVNAAAFESDPTLRQQKIDEAICGVPGYPL